MSLHQLSELEVVARTLWGEARGEGLDGMRAVAAVIYRRGEIAHQYKLVKKRNHPLFGDGTMRGACLVRSQFSCWNPEDPNREKLLGEINDPAYQNALGIAELAIAGKIIDPTGGATHYVTTRAYKSFSAWHWTRRMKITARIGAHVFMQEPTHQ